MAFSFNGNTPKVITFNNQDVKKLIWGNTVVWEKRRLPNEYQEVEYIKSSGTQYINLPFGFNNTDTVILKGCINQAGSQDHFMVAPSTWNNNSNRFAMTGSYGYNCCVGYGSSPTSATRLLPLTTNDGKIHNWVYDNYEFKIEELLISLDVSNIHFGGPTANLKLFYGYGSNSKGKISYYKHIKENINICELIACYRKSDEEIGLYDIINQEFYTNAGTGIFEKGPDVN